MYPRKRIPSKATTVKYLLPGCPFLERGLYSASWISSFSDFDCE